MHVPASITIAKHPLHMHKEGYHITCNNFLSQNPGPGYTVFVSSSSDAHVYGVYTFFAAIVRQVWSATAEAAQGGAAETGALSRLHSALIAVVTHVVTRLGSRALGDPQVSNYGSMWGALCSVYKYIDLWALLDFAGL